MLASRAGHDRVPGRKGDAAVFPLQPGCLQASRPARISAFSCRLQQCDGTSTSHIAGASIDCDAEAAFRTVRIQHSAASSVISRLYMHVASADWLFSSCKVKGAQSSG